MKRWTSQQLTFDAVTAQWSQMLAPTKAYYFRCYHCQQLKSGTRGVLTYCYRDRRIICDECYEALLVSTGVRVCWDCRARGACAYLNNYDWVKANGWA